MKDKETRIGGTKLMGLPGRLKRVMIWILMGGAMIFNLFGCGKVKYKVTADSGYELEKTKYAFGDRVTAVYGMVATDTDYSFYADSPDVTLDRSYEEGKGYVVSFTMPEHDVKLLVNSVESMSCISEGEDAKEPDIQELYEKSTMIFNYYESTVATESGGQRREYALYDYGNRGRYIFAKFSQNDSGEETCELCMTTDTPYKKCLELVEQYDMRHWEEEESLEGGLYVVRIAYGQEILRISSDSMAKNGTEAFSAISKYLDKAWGMYRGMMDDE